MTDDEPPRPPVDPPVGPPLYAGTDDGIRSRSTPIDTFLDALLGHLPKPAALPPKHPDRKKHPLPEGTPICFRCGRAPSEVPSMVDYAKEENAYGPLDPKPALYTDLESHTYTPDDMAREDGTYNPLSNHFCCDECYIALGMPSSPTGWKAP